MNRIRLLGMKDIEKFLALIANVEGKLDLVNPGSGHRISARSVLGLLLASTEWGDNVYLDSDKDIYNLIEEFIVIGDDTVSIHE